MGLVLFGQKQAGGVHIAAANMGVDIDRPRHDDAAGRINDMIGPAASRCGDDLLVFNPDIANARTAVNRIYDFAAGNLRQHGSAFPPGRASVIDRKTMAADGEAESGFAAASAFSVPVLLE